MLDFVRKQDVVIVSEYSRLARSTRDLLDIVQGEGIALAKAAGKYKGRTRAKKPGNWAELKANYFTRKMGISDLAKECKVSRPTIYMWLKEE